MADYRAVDPRLGAMADFDALVKDAEAHQIRVIVDLVPNHCSSEHPLFRAALAAGPGSRERARFIFRAGRGPHGDLPPNNWESSFGGPAWTRVTEADGSPGQWYLHLYDSSQPDWNWRDEQVHAMFEEVLRFWLDRGTAGVRVDVAHGLYKDPDLPDDPDPNNDYRPLNAPSPYRHRPEIHQLFRSWRALLDSYPTDGFPGVRTAIGEVWYDAPDTLRPYLAPDGLPQVFNFQLIVASWDVAGFRAAIDGVQDLAGGSRAPWVIGNHDVPRPASRYRLDGGYTPVMIDELVALGDARAELGARRARAAALLLFALPGSAYIYQGEELGLPEVTDLPAAARQDPRFHRTGGKSPGRDGCRVPLPWSRTGASFGFSGDAADPAPAWLPSRLTGAATASRRSWPTPARSSACTARPYGCAASTRPWAAAPCGGWISRAMPRPRACSASPGNPASSSPRTWARTRPGSRRTAASCWPANRTRWTPRAACAPTRPCGYRPDPQ